jgi:hypothetical protein
VRHRRRRVSGALILVVIVPAMGCSLLFGLEEHADTPDAALADVSAPKEDSAPTDDAAIGLDAGADVRTDGPCDPMTPFGSAVYQSVLTDTAMDDNSARMTADLLTVDVTRKPLDGGAGQLWTSTRDAASIAFPAPTLLPGAVNGPMGAQQATRRDDRSLLFFSTDLGGSTSDLYMASRNEAGAYVNPQPLTTVNTVNFELAPFLAADQSSLYYYLVHGGGGAGVAEAGIYVTHVANDGGFTSRELVMVDDGDATAPHNPVVVNGGLTLYYARPVGPQVTDIVVATRATTQDHFKVVRTADELNSVHREQPTWASEDGCIIVFSRSDEAGKRSIQMATKSPP